MYDENERIIRNRNPNSNRGIRRSFATESGTKSPNRETLWDLEIEKEKAESQSENGDNFDYKARKRRNDEIVINQNLISSISSTGVLVKSLNKTADSILDFIFVMNVRESEIYPPLYLAEDIACVEEKMKNYQGEFDMKCQFKF